MKYCPNPVCPYVRRFRQPAEFTDRGSVCNDCSMPLVGKAALGTAETASAVASWHAQQSEAAAAVEEAKPGGGGPGRLDVTTGAALIGLSVLLLVASYMTAVTMGGGNFFIAAGPFVYGVIRLKRGLDARNAAR